MNLREKAKKKLFNLMTSILRRLPGGELRRCHNLSWQNTDCILHFNHWGKCEDAWGYKWTKNQSL